FELLRSRFVFRRRDGGTLEGLFLQEDHCTTSSRPPRTKGDQACDILLLEAAELMRPWKLWSKPICVREAHGRARPGGARTGSASMGRTEGSAGRCTQRQPQREPSQIAPPLQSEAGLAGAWLWRRDDRSRSNEPSASRWAGRASNSGVRTLLPAGSRFRCGWRGNDLSNGS